MSKMLSEELRQRLGIISAADLLDNTKGLHEGKQRFNSKELLANFSKVFKKSIPSDAFANIQTSPVDNKFIKVSAIAMGSGNKQYKNHIQFYKESKDDTLSVFTPVVLKCDCDAFHYWLAYPLYSGNSLYGKPKKWNKVPAYDKNPGNVPTVCKHLHGLLDILIRQGVISR